MQYMEKISTVILKYVILLEPVNLKLLLSSFLGLYILGYVTNYGIAKYIKLYVPKANLYYLT